MRPERAAGAGAVVVERAGGKSRVTSAWARSPLKLLTPRNHGHAAWVYTASFGGGLVDGDALTLDVEVGTGATALLATQAQTKVYRGPRGASQRLEARVRPAALFAALPDPVACYAGARYRQEVTITLDDDASLVWLDAVSAGRAARGERWAFAAFSSRTRVERGGRPLVHDALLLRPDEGELGERLRGHEALATLLVVGPRCAEARALLLGTAEVCGPLVVAASPLGDDGAILRIAAPSVESLLDSVHARLAFLPALLGDDPLARHGVRTGTSLISSGSSASGQENG